MVKVGDSAPDFSLPSTNGETVSLQSLRGSWAVLYFYPRDNTPGCTMEACDFRDNTSSLEKAGVRVLGVSKDSLESHERFREKRSLPFELLYDEGNQVAKAYGAYGPKKIVGIKTTGFIRSTFLIGPKGIIEAVWSPVKVKGHVAAVLEAVGDLQKN